MVQPPPSEFRLRRFQKQALRFLELPMGQKRIDLLCIAPTGSGKSLIYERIAASGEKTLLITPLVSLARQQFLRLREIGVDVRLHAGGERQAPPVGRGAWIISPEALELPSVKEGIGRFRPGFLVVDECHCLWEWGEVFRPAFQRIPRLLQLPHVRRSLWLSATLPTEARKNLESELQQWGRKLRQIGKFALPEKLVFRAIRVEWKNRTEALLKTTSELEGAGIVFVQSREAAERITRLLRATGEVCVAYHAGLSSEERLCVESQVRHGSVRVVVSTSAFGMGMDFQQLCWIVFWQAPPSLLSLSQMSGRVGRGGKKGEVRLFWHEEDFRLIEWIARGSEKNKVEILNVKNFLTDVRCRREILGKYFNGTIVQRSECKQCDNCLSLIVS